MAIRPLIRSMTPDDAAAASRKVQEHLATRKEIHDGLVMGFAPIEEEPDLTGLLTTLACNGSLVLPRVSWDNGTMVPCQVTDLDADLVVDRHRIRVPAPHCPTVQPEQLAAILVPGVAFDRLGNRLGRGKGFYDRLLSHPDLKAVRIGIAFSCQVVESVPCGPQDCPVDLLVTDSDVIDCKKNRSDRATKV